MAGSISSGRRGGRWKPKAEINVTPFVDVMLVLLIVFMITAPMLAVGVPVELPETEASSMAADDEPLTVTIGASGEIYLQETAVELEQLIPRLQAISGAGFEGRIFIRGDEAADYGSVVRVMAHISSAGFTNLGLVTDPISTGSRAENPDDN